MLKDRWPVPLLLRTGPKRTAILVGEVDLRQHFRVAILQGDYSSAIGSVNLHIDLTHLQLVSLLGILLKAETRRLGITDSPHTDGGKNCKSY